MATAIVGVGNTGATLARDLIRGGEPVVLAAKDEANAAALAQELGDLARHGITTPTSPAAASAVWMLGCPLEQLGSGDADSAAVAQ